MEREALSTASYLVSLLTEEQQSSGFARDERSEGSSRALYPGEGALRLGLAFFPPSPELLIQLRTL